MIAPLWIASLWQHCCNRMNRVPRASGAMRVFHNRTMNFKQILCTVGVKMIEEDIYSNLAVIPFTLDEITWHSAEQYFQAAKFTDNEIIDKIKACSNPLPVCHPWPDKGIQAAG